MKSNFWYDKDWNNHFNNLNSYKKKLAAVMSCLTVLRVFLVGLPRDQ